MNSFDRIYAVVRRIPRGTVATYGQVALLAGNPRWARVVGYALHVNPDPEGIPCYRVVTKDGRTSPAFAFGGADMQRALLEADGVGFTPDGRVEMEVQGEEEKMTCLKDRLRNSRWIEIHDIEEQSIPVIEEREFRIGN